MFTWGHIVTCVILFEYVNSLRSLQQYRIQQLNEKQGKKDITLRRILESLANTKAYLTGERRALSHGDLANARTVVKSLSEKMSPRQLNMFLTETMQAAVKPQLRQGETGFDKMVEKELTDTMVKSQVALLQKPHIESKGRNDFLVIGPGVRDPFVTVIPNNIYYDIEKKCVNWLDDCSLQGIRSKLLQKARGPFK